MRGAERRAGEAGGEENERGKNSKAVEESSSGFFAFGIQYILLDFLKTNWLLMIKKKSYKNIKCPNNMCTLLRCS